MKIDVNKLLDKRRMKLGWLMMIFALVFEVVFGCLGIFKGKTMSILARDSSYWTVSGNGLSMTIVDVSENGVDINSTWSNYTFKEKEWEFWTIVFGYRNNKNGVRYIV